VPPGSASAAELSPQPLVSTTGITRLTKGVIDHFKQGEVVCGNTVHSDFRSHSLKSNGMGKRGEQDRSQQLPIPLRGKAGFMQAIPNYSLTQGARHHGKYEFYSSSKARCFLKQRLKLLLSLSCRLLQISSATMADNQVIFPSDASSFSP